MVKISAMGAARPPPPQPEDVVDEVAKRAHICYCVCMTEHVRACVRACTRARARSHA
jgi:hypothetical protein